jgi:hypothetical protein
MAASTSQKGSTFCPAERVLGHELMVYAGLFRGAVTP